VKLISIIIPTLNEADSLPGLLSQLIKSSDQDFIKEIIVSDGNSTDGTIQIAEHFGVRLIINAFPCRARQLNAGAAMATGEILYFLHADSVPPKKVATQILLANTRGAEAGCFRLRFDWDHWFLNLNAWFTRFNVSAFRFGDQSLFVTKQLFDKTRGFREDHSIMEDQEIVSRLRKEAPFVVIPDFIVTSARKYMTNGVYRMQGIFFYLYFAYLFGASQSTLQKLYQRLIH